jgi:hypothetical protein
MLTVSALVDDNFKAVVPGSLSDVGQVTAAVTGPCAAVAGAPVKSIVSGGVDDKKIRVTVQLATTAAHDGACKVELSAKDRAGNASAKPAASFVVDNTAPGVTITSAAWAASGNRTLMVTTSEPVESISASVDGGAAAVVETDTAGQPVGTSWSKAFTLAEGAHTVVVTAIDRAGNVGPTPSATAPFGVDLTGPTVKTVDHDMADELAAAPNGGCQVTSTATVVNVDCSAATAKTTLTATNLPQVNKYSHRLRGSNVSGEVGENPIEWRFEVSDALSGPAATGLKYKLRGPATAGCGETGLLDATPHLVSLGTVGGARRYSFQVTTASAGAVPGCGVDPIENLAGKWELTIQAVDTIGNVGAAAAGQMDWTHKPLGVPVFIGNGGSLISGFTDAFASLALGRVSLAADNLAAVLNGTDARGVYQFQVTNPSDRATRAAFFVPTPEVGKWTYSRTAGRWNHSLGIVPPSSGNLTCSKGTITTRLTHPETNAPSVACAGTGWKVPSDQPDTKTNVPLTGANHFRVVLLKANGGGGGFTVVPLAGTTTIAGSTAYEFVIDPGADWRVMIAVNDFSFLKPPGGFAMKEQLPPFFNNNKLVTGKVYEDYLVCNDTSENIPPTCIEQQKFRHFEWVQSASVFIFKDSATLGVRLRPTGGSVIDFAELPSLSDDVDTAKRSNSNDLNWTAGAD